jgi:3-oxoacyl-[acyl-carrier protein] reductase
MFGAYILNKLITKKTFIVTGAAGGIGKRLVEDMLNLDINIVATDIDISLLRNYLNSRPNNSSKLLVMKHDVRNEKDWLSILSEIDSKGWDLYGLINCAAVLLPGYIKNIQIKDIDFHFDINTKGTILGCTIVSQYLKKNNKKGHLINIASLAGVAPIPGIALYSASKFAVRGFSIALGYELKSEGILVSVICPDAVNTPMLDLQVPYEEASLTFSGSTLQPSDISNIIINTINNYKLEILIPSYRGILAKLGNLFPSLAYWIISPLKKKGRNNQNKIKST